MKKVSFVFILLSIFSFLYSEETLNVRAVALWPYTSFALVMSKGIEAIDSTAIVGMVGGFWFFDLTNPSMPRKIGECITRGHIRDILIKDNFLYVADLEKGFRVFDITSIPNVREIARVSGRAYEHLTLKDTIAFISQSYSFQYPGRDDTIEIFNISDPNNPQRIGKFSIGRGWVCGIFIDSNRAYIPSSIGGLKIYDISNPGNPSFLGQWVCPEERRRVYSVTTKDTIAYIGSHDTLWILNVSNPQQIREISKIRLGTDPDAEGSVTALILLDTIILASIWGDSGCIVNIKNPLLPRIIKRVSVLTKGITLKGSLLFVPLCDWVILYDFSNLDILRLLGRFETPTLAMNTTPINDSLLFLGCWGRRHFILDISTPPTVRVRGQFPSLPDSNYLDFSSYSARPAIRDSFIFTGFLGGNSLYILKFPNPDTILLVDSLLLGRPPYVNVRSVLLRDSIAFVCGSEGWLGFIWVCNVADPSNPVLISRASAPNADFFHIVVKNNYAYIAGGNGGFCIFDVSDIRNPHLITHFIPSPQYMNDIFVKDTFAFIANSFDGLRVFNIRDPYNPREVLTIPSTFQTVGVWIEGNLLFLAEGYGGLRIYDISNFYSPREVGYYRVRAVAGKVRLFNNLIHLANDIGGYYLLEYYGIGIEERKKGRSERIEKMPTIGKNIKVKVANSISYEIYDASGKLVFKSQKEKNDFDIKSTGIYFLVTRRGKDISLQKIVNLN